MVLNGRRLYTTPCGILTEFHREDPPHFIPKNLISIKVIKQKYLTTEGKLLFKPSGGPAGQWMQRSFQFNHNYLTLFDANLKEYGIDPSDSNHKVHVNELYYSNFDKYKRKFLTKAPNDLTNWDRKRIISSLSSN